MAQDKAAAEAKFSEATAQAMRRFTELQQDEAWKEANCRLCPHCGKTVYKVDGCDSMTCGRDAADKGGGNQQNGCGQAFRWNQAKPYKRPSTDAARLPKSLSDVDPGLDFDLFKSECRKGISLSFSLARQTRTARLAPPCWSFKTDLVRETKH